MKNETVHKEKAGLHSNDDMCYTKVYSFTCLEVNCFVHTPYSEKKNVFRNVSKPNKINFKKFVIYSYSSMLSVAQCITWANCNEQSIGMILTKAAGIYPERIPLEIREWFQNTQKILKLAIIT